MSGLERAAQAYAAYGFDVFPLQPRGKRPLRRGWPHHATRDPDAVHELWQGAPDANVGVRCGGGLLVLDADTPAAVDALHELGLPDTTTVRSSRGLHVYLRGEAPTRAGVRAGLDVRGCGGYVVGAGSLHPSGAVYAWEVPPWEAPPAPAPERVLTLVTARAGDAPRAVGGRARAESRGPIPQGCRNTTLTRVGGRLRRAELGFDGILAALLAENAARCRPPVPRDEVEAIARSVSRMEGPPPWVSDLLRFAEHPGLSSNARHVLRLLAGRARHDGTVRGGDWLAEAAALHRNTIGRAIAEIEAAGLLTASRRRREATLYQLQKRAHSGLQAVPPPPTTGKACTTGVHQEMAGAPSGRAA